MSPQTESTTNIDPHAFRDVMGHYPTGVVVVTAQVDDVPVGMVVGTFSSVSLDPPLVSFMPMTSSSSYARLRAAGAVTISVFAHDQIAVCRTLASKDQDKFDKVDWQWSAHRTPQINGAVAHIHGRIAQEIEAGDHFITLVAVDDLAVVRPATPLLFFQGGYGGFSTTGLAAHVDESLISAVRVAEASRPQLDHLARQFGCTAAALIQVSAVDQTIGATSYGADSDADERIGVRIPLIPPLGEAAVAWDAVAVERWVGRIYPPDPEVTDAYRAAAERVRAQGYAVSRVGDEPDVFAALNEALVEYAGGELSPARDRAVRGSIAAAEGSFGGSICPEAASVDIASIVVPVFCPLSDNPTNSGLVLRLGNLPQGVSGAEAHVWISALQEAARGVTTALKAEAMRDYARYTASDLRNS